MQPSAQYNETQLVNVSLWQDGAVLDSVFQLLPRVCVPNLRLVAKSGYYAQVSCGV